MIIPARMGSSCLVALFLGLEAAAAWAGSTRDSSIDPQRLSTITRALASDAFEGREPGTTGEGRTVDYIVRQFKSLGLKPGARGGRWTQSVPLLKTQIEGHVSVGVVGSGRHSDLSYPDEVHFTTSRDAPALRLDAVPIVFVGYGVHAPERGWDDFKQVDLKGKIALFLVNDPDFQAAPGDDSAGRFGGKAMTYYGRWSYKFEEAARRGAIAALVIHETEAAGYGWNVISAAAGTDYSLDQGSDATKSLIAKGWIARDAAARLLALNGLDLDRLKRQARSREFRPIELNASMSATAKVSARHIVSQNVLAMLPGASRPDEAIVFGAHWDAFGVDRNAAGGPVIRHGAADNALGVAAVIDIARAFSSGPRPRRSVIFAAWTAEERGLLGAEYYAEHPTIPLQRTVANLTFDVLQTLGASRNFVLIGKGQNDLEDAASKQAAAQGRIVTQEMYPERGLYFRSDHFAFARRGVPAMLAMGLAGDPDVAAGGTEAGSAWIRNYTQNCYHQACDAWSPDWNLVGAAQDIELFFRIGRDLANGASWPQWKPGSEFRERRAASQAARKRP